MEKFTTHTGIGVPLRRSNVDTDQIIPAVYLKRVTRTGFEDGLFAAWRNDETFVLNDPGYAGGSVLVAGPDFGTGSSREHGRSPRSTRRRGRWPSWWSRRRPDTSRPCGTSPPGAMRSAPDAGSGDARSGRSPPEQTSRLDTHVDLGPPTVS